MIAALNIARRQGISSRRVFIVALGVIFVGSLASSVWITAYEPAWAYFVTYTRIWELALGGLLSLLIQGFRAGPSARAAISVAGLGAIMWSAFVYSPTTAFPGIAALVPTLGTALVIMGGDIRLGFFRGLNARWLIYLGDRSYSIYLWHWPLIAFYTVHHKETGPADGIGLIALTLLISHLSYQHIEQRYRHPRRSGEKTPLAYGMISILGCVAAASALQQILAVQASVVYPTNPDYPGSLAILSDINVPAVESPIPPLAALKNDLPAAYGERCHVPVKSSDVKPCRLGDPNGTQHIVLVGDSHAANWIPALDAAASARGWRLETHTKSGCSPLKLDVTLRGQAYEACSTWGKQVLAWLLEQRPEVVVFTQSVGQRLFPNERDDPMGDMTLALKDVWSDLLAAGIKVVAIRDTPRLPFDPDECLDDTACAASLDDIFPRADPIPMAAAEMGVPLIDMTDAFCTSTSCPVVIGNIVVWRDRHHLTATFSRTIGAVLGDRIHQAVNSQ
jgi:hypothetical protein